MTSIGGSRNSSGKIWFLIPSIIIVFVAIILPLLSLKYHHYPTNESINSFGNALGNAVGDVLGETSLGDSLGDAIGDIIGDVVTDLLDGDDDEDDATGGTSGGGGSLCSLSEDGFATDAALQTMAFDIGHGPQEMQVYVQPDVSTFYVNDDDDDNEHRERKQPKHDGWAAKFVNISTRTVRLFWCPNHGGACSPMSVMRPFDSAGTASFPRHTFHIEDDETREIVAKFIIDPPTSVYYYDAITVSDNVDATMANVDKLTSHEQRAYKAHIDSRKFSEYYYAFTGRQYLSFYPRAPPIHKLWPANYFGQEHWVASRETHFITNPPLSELTSIDEFGGERILRDNDARLLSRYRRGASSSSSNDSNDANNNYLNMTLRVISCAPRAFEINDFLSQAEVDHILYLTTGLSLVRSTTAGGAETDAAERDHTKDTRTSLNTWVYREKDAIMDTIYRRAADLLRIDEALLRPRSVDEYPHMDNTRSLAEALQLEYTAHHDFGYAKYNSEKKQPARFATLLLYLNEPEEGGATSFPRWANAETNEGLDVEPKRGKAVLFYSQLPDGNMDDLSQHAALPVRVGEKWLMNLWVWDPIYG